MGIENIALILLPLEFWLLYRAQRDLFWHFERLTNRRWITYFLVMPSTVAHELAHAAMAAVLGVPFGRRCGGEVKLFSPREDPKTGGITLGYVSVAVTDPLRNSLISIAPVILVPVFFWLATWGLLGDGNPLVAVNNLTSLPYWRIGVWLGLAVLMPLAAFPSIGDKVSAVGALSLILATGLLGWILWQDNEIQSILNFLVGWSNLLLVPAVVSAIVLMIVRVRA